MTHVMIVDDEPMLIEEMKEALEFEGCEVSSAQSVEEALRHCADTVYDVVVTDLKMPKASGIELIRQLNDRGYPAIMFVVSGHGAETNKSEALELGAKACFSKPLDVDDLMDAISENL